jgi:hypothetical protein
LSDSGLFTGRLSLRATLEPDMSNPAPSWLESIVAGARNPHNWLGSAEELKRASDLLRETWLDEAKSMQERFQAYMAGELVRPWEPWVGAPAMTLAAFAIENLLKGLMIAAEPSLVQPRAAAPEILFDRRIQTHKLLELATSAKVQLSREETDLLARLSEFASWAGRYRFPVQARAAAPRPGVEGGGSSFTSEWFSTLDGLVDRLHEDLFQAGVRADRDREAAKR